MSDDELNNSDNESDSDSDNESKPVLIKINPSVIKSYEEGDDSEPDDAINDEDEDEDEDEIIGGRKEDGDGDGDEDEDEDDEEESDDEELEKQSNEDITEKLKQNKKPKTNQLLIEDDEDDEDDDYDNNYLQKFDNDLINNYINEFHPECLSHNYDEISKLSVVIRNEDGIIIDPIHRTIPYLTKYERARILGQRAKQIETGAKPLVKVPENIIDGYIIAELELKEKKIPFIIRRPIPGGACEYWNLRDLEIIGF
jgi:DNA-directed RNA polymerase I, II, and III subunit RPABC2